MSPADNGARNSFSIFLTVARSETSVRASGRGQAHGLPPAIQRVAAPLDQPTLLEPVQQADELAAVEPQRVRDRRLGLARPLVEEGEHAEVVRRESLSARTR